MSQPPRVAPFPTASIQKLRGPAKLDINSIRCITGVENLTERHLAASVASDLLLELCKQRRRWQAFYWDEMVRLISVNPDAWTASYPGVAGFVHGPEWAIAVGLSILVRLGLVIIDDTDEMDRFLPIEGFDKLFNSD